MDELIANLVVFLICLGAVASLLALFAIFMAGFSAQQDVTLRQFEPLTRAHEEMQLLHLADLLGLSLVIGSGEPPLSATDIKRPFFHDKQFERRLHVMQGIRDERSLELFEQKIITIPASPKRSRSIRRYLCLSIQSTSLSSLMFHIRPSTWVDLSKSDGFKVSKSFVWGEPLSLLRECIDWETIMLYEQFSGVLVRAQGSQIDLTWPFETAKRRKWPEKEAILDFVRFGERLAEQLEEGLAVEDRA